jgi:hypothetical protein
VAREVVFLESDALDFDETPVRPRTGGTAAAVERPSGAEPESAPEGTQEAAGPDGPEDEAVVDRGAMYETFDAAAYRRELARIAGHERSES